jgi:hypothetical protein
MAETGLTPPASQDKSFCALFSKSAACFDSPVTVFSFDG